MQVARLLHSVTPQQYQIYFEVNTLHVPHAFISSSNRWLLQVTWRASQQQQQEDVNFLCVWCGPGVRGSLAAARKFETKNCKIFAKTAAPLVVVRHNLLPPLPLPPLRSKTSFWKYVSFHSCVNRQMI